MSATSAHAHAAASGGLAAAIAMAVAQVVFLATGLGPLGALQWGLSLAAIGFGGTYAGVFFLGRGKRARAQQHASVAGA